MTLVLVEVPNEEAIEALRQQKDVRVVGVVSEPKATSAPAIVLAQPVRKWAGALSDADSDSLRAHAEQVRAEWERNI